MLNGFSIHNSGAVIDFDRTFSQDTGNTSIGVIGTSPNIPQALRKERDRLIAYYGGIERDLSMDPEERKRHMIEWHRRSEELLKEYLTQAHMQGIIEHAIEEIHVREGFLDFLHFLNRYNVPVLIYSAGISNTIQGILEHHQVPCTGIYGNELGFDRNGNCIGISNKVPIHNENKVWETIPKELRHAFSDRTHMIVMGDSIGDIRMGSLDRQLMKVGFLVSSQKPHEQAFRDNFDVVIESDTCDRGFLAELGQKLLEA